MTTLAEAQKALEAARAEYAQAEANLRDRRQHQQQLIGELEFGNYDGVTPEDLIAARAAVEKAEIVHNRTQRLLHPAEQAVGRARVEDLCDRLLAAIPEKQGELAKAAEAVSDALSDFVAAAIELDAIMEEGRAQVTRASHQATPRVEVPRFGHVTIDRVPLRPCRGAAQLAKVVLPALRQLSAPLGVLNDVSVLAQEAPPLDRTTP